MKLYAPSTIREIKNKHDIQLQKSLGQNFLTDKNIIDKIIDAADIGPEDIVIEIGPGLGVLTMPAAERAEKVITIEVDRHLIPVLKDTLSGFDNIEIINQDFLKINLINLFEQNGIIDRSKKVKIIGNLPYYITTPIIMKILEEKVPACSITIMMQKEVADRIRSAPGSRTYGALSVAVQYYCEVKDIAKVPKEVFYPAPKVDSQVLRLDIRKEPPVPVDDEKIFFACVKNGFGQRRKTLGNSLTGVCGLTKEEVKTVLEKTGIDPRRRAETLGLDEFALLSNAVGKMRP